MEQGEAGDHEGRKHDPKQISDLAAKLAPLPPGPREALNHRVRRQILRTLIASDEPQSPSEIVATGLPDSSISIVSYHADVLESCGTVTRSAIHRDPDNLTLLYASTVTDPQVVSLLEATRQLDSTDD